MAGVAVASGQFINQSIKLADVKRAINQSENSLSINQVEALKLELVDYADLWFPTKMKIPFGQQPLAIGL